jgi:hypothetical protein
VDDRAGEGEKPKKTLEIAAFDALVIEVATGRGGGGGTELHALRTRSVSGAVAVWQIHLIVRSGGRVQLSQQTATWSHSADEQVERLHDICLLRHRFRAWQSRLQCIDTYVLRPGLAAAGTGALPSSSLTASSFPSARSNCKLHGAPEDYKARHNRRLGRRKD